MYPDALALHPSEPGHLAFRELMDGIAQERLHLLEAEYSQNILRNELVLKPIVSQILCGNAALKQSPYLIRHAFLDPCVQPRIDSPVPLLT